MHMVLDGRIIERKTKSISMKLKYLLLTFIIAGMIACNNEASVQDDTDSATKVNDTLNQSDWPENRDIMGKDSIPSPETQADTSSTTPKR